MVLNLVLKEFDTAAVKYQYQSLLPQIYTEHSFSSAINCGGKDKRFLCL